MYDPIETYRWHVYGRHRFEGRDVVKIGLPIPPAPRNWICAITKTDWIIFTENFILHFMFTVNYEWSRYQQRAIFWNRNPSIRQPFLMRSNLINTHDGVSLKTCSLPALKSPFHLHLGWRLSPGSPSAGSTCPWQSSLWGLRERSRRHALAQSRLPRGCPG